MKIKHVQILGVLVAGVFLLAGCGNNNQSSSSQPTTSSSQKKTSSSSTKSNNKKASTLWNNSKDKQLESFINQWAPTMHQSYTKYDGTTPIKTSVGATYPTDLNKESVDGGSSTIGWSKDGEGKYDYNVVAIYNYDKTVAPIGRITYLFAFHNGQPVALVDQSNNGGPVALPTQNTQVQSNFEKIAGGSSSVQSSSNSSRNNSGSTSSKGLTRDNKLIAVMVYQEAFGTLPESNDNFYFGFDNDSGRYNVSQGSTISDVQFLVQGNVVHYWKLDPDSDQPTAMAPQKEYTIGLTQLENKYYSNSVQKQKVQTTSGQFQDDNG